MKTAIVGVFLSPFILIAQQNGSVWRNIGPTPAAIESIVMDPRGSGTIFIGALGGGVRKSVDDGVTWSAVNSGLATPIVYALAMDASGPQTVYAGTSAGGLFKTRDGGITWQNIPAISGSVASVAADPNRSGVVYAGVFNNLANGSIRKSIDGGVSWTTIFPSTAAIFNITIDPGNSDVLYAPTVGHGAFKSTDGGQHWSPISALTPTAIWTFALDPANSQILYAGTNEDGVWKSTDAGNTWQQAGSTGAFPIYSLTVDPSAAHIIYAGTNGGGVWASSDAGVTWHSTGFTTGMVWSLATDSAGALYAGTNASGAQVSRDRGVTWTILHTGTDAVNKFGYGTWIGRQQIFVSSELGYGMVGSQDGGATWSVTGQSFTGYGSRGVAFDPSDSQKIYAGATVGNVFFKSIDGGLTWSSRRFGSPAVYVIAVAVDPLSPNIVYAGTQNEGVFKSTDYGDTWSSAGSGLSGAITYLTPDPTKSGRLFASTATAFYLSEDGGKGWANVLNMPAWTVTMDPNTSSTIYATTRTLGVFRSLDGGHTWQGINTGLTNLSMGRSAPVILDPTNPNTLYVGSEGGGVFKSLDGGVHWFAVNSGLGELTVDGLAMDPSNPAVLYACGPNGVYKTVTGAEVQSAPTISAVLNGASYLAGPVSPDEIVLITGSWLGPSQLIVATPGNDGLYSSTQLSGTTVQFNGTAAPVIYVAGNQVAVRVPLFSVGAAQVTVTYEGRTSGPFPLQVTQNSPGLFTLDSSGKGQAVAINQDGSINSPVRLAAAGDVISLYGTGVTSGQGGVFVTVGGQDAMVSYTSSDGVTRFDVRIPGGILTSRAVPVVVLISQDAIVSSQSGVTVALQDANQTAANTSIGWATAVTTDPAGNVYFISSSSVFKVDAKGALTRVAGKPQPGYSGDGGPAIDAQLFTDDLVNAETLFGVPSGLALDSKGNLYISDGGNARIRKVSPDGIITTVAGDGTRGYSGDGGPATAAQLANPHGLGVDSAGNLYIADTVAVRKVSTAGTISTVALIAAVGVAVDGSGSLFVVDYHRVLRVSTDGSVKTVAGGTGIIGDGGDGGPATSAAFIVPMTVALDRGGNLYIGDVYRVRKVSPDGIINTAAGGGKDYPGDGGPATNAQIAVESIAIDASGNLYIAGYGRVRRVSVDGTITTVAGNGK